MTAAGGPCGWFTGGGRHFGAEAKAAALRLIRGVVTAVYRGMGVLLRVLVAAGLAADAFVHWRFAPDMAPGPHAPANAIGGDVLFRAEAVAAVVTGLLVLAWARRWTYALAFLVAASAIGAVVLYYSVDFGQLGPIPRMYDPVWSADKTISLAGEGVAALAALVGFLTVRSSGLRDRLRPADSPSMNDRAVSSSRS